MARCLATWPRGEGEFLPQTHYRYTKLSKLPKKGLKQSTFWLLVQVHVLKIFILKLNRRVSKAGEHLQNQSYLKLSLIFSPRRWRRWADFFRKCELEVVAPSTSEEGSPLSPTVQKSREAMDRGGEMMDVKLLVESDWKRFHGNGKGWLHVPWSRHFVLYWRDVSLHLDISWECSIYLQINPGPNFVCIFSMSYLWQSVLSCQICQIAGRIAGRWIPRKGATDATVTRRASLSEVRGWKKPWDLGILKQAQGWMIEKLLSWLEVIVGMSGTIERCRTLSWDFDVFGWFAAASGRALFSTTCSLPTKFSRFLHHLVWSLGDLQQMFDPGWST